MEDLDVGPGPREARTAAEFVAALRALKELSGLTYRQLERRAEAEGEFLARSTLADALSRDQLPREELVAVFVRGCGCSEVQAWLEARGRLASAATTDPRAEPAGRRQAPRRARLARLRVVLGLGAATAMGAVAMGALTLWTDPSDNSTADDASGGSRKISATPTPSPPPLPAGTYRIPADGLCLAEGRGEETGAGTHVFFYQTACTTGCTRVFLRDSDEGTYKTTYSGRKGESPRCLRVVP